MFTCLGLNGMKLKGFSMTIYKDGGKCDDCGDFEAVHGYQCAGAIAATLKHRGWIVIDDRWQCPKCISAPAQCDLPEHEF